MEREKVERRGRMKRERKNGEKERRGRRESGKWDVGCGEKWEGRCEGRGVGC